jgi:FtsH-binding integral membrane protein
MIRVYNYMASGVALTGLVAWLTYSAAVINGTDGQVTGLTTFGQAIYGGPLTIILFALCRLTRTHAVVGVSGLYGCVDHPHLLHISGIVWRVEPLARS